MSKISIFIPVYNGESYLAKTIDSILNSSFKDFEALFVDDGSSDTSVDILKAASIKDKRIKVFVKEHEGSVPYSWNFIFKYIKSPWTLYMSHDDLLHPNLLENLIITQQKTNADCVIPSCRFFTEEKGTDAFPELNKINDMTWRAKLGSVSGKTAFELMFDYEIPGFALWKTDLIKKIGMPTEAFNSDEGMQRIWILNCNIVAFEPTPFYYRLHNNSIGSGIKLHHFFSVRTEQKLLNIAKQEKISEIKIHKAQYKSLFWTLWLYAYLRNHKNDFSSNYQDIITTLNDAYSYFCKDLSTPISRKDKILYFISKSLFAKYLYIVVYSLYLKKWCKIIVNSCL